VLPPWIRPIVEDDDDGYQLYLPPKEELEKIAERNVRVLGADAPVTCAILFRTDRLELAMSIPENDNDKEKKKGSSSSSRHDVVDTNTCVSLCLKGKPGSVMESMGPVIVTSVHLDATDETKRVGQLSKCLRRARHLQNNNVELLSTIVAGDMNQECYPGSCITAFLLDSLETKASDADREQQCASALRLGRQVPTKDQLKEWNELYTESQHTVREYCVSLRRMDTGTTRSAYDHDVVVEEQAAVPKPPIMGQWRLDHILYTPRTLQPCAYWSTLEDDPESCTLGLPNHRHGSDHIPIGALFRVVQPPPRLLDVERTLLLDRLKQVVKDQSQTLCEKQASLETELASIEAHLPPPPKEEDIADESESSSNKKKRKKKKGPPPKEIMEFIRTKRSILKALKEKQKEEGRVLVETLGDLERLLLAHEFGYSSASQWVVLGGGG
jgi:hypothetical protein